MWDFCLRHSSLWTPSASLNFSVLFFYLLTCLHSSFLPSSSLHFSLSLCFYSILFLLFPVLSLLFYFSFLSFPQSPYFFSIPLLSFPRSPYFFSIPLLILSYLPSFLCHYSSLFISFPFIIFRILSLCASFSSFFNFTLSFPSTPFRPSLHSSLLLFLSLLCD